jgi:hypothetical protein
LNGYKLSSVKIIYTGKTNFPFKPMVHSAYQHNVVGQY